MAKRDAIVAFASELLEVERFRDYGPIGLQVEGTSEVGKIVCAVSASLELFELATERGAQMVLVHHGLFWNNEALVIDRRQKGRLKALFDADLSLVAYHLALDAHAEIGNSVLLARELGVEPERAFDEIGTGGRLTEPSSAQDFVSLVRETLGREPLAFLHGPEPVRTVAIVTGGGGPSLLQAAREGYDLFLTGEPKEPSLHAARELGIHFVAAGHYATERLGIQALASRIGERFGIEWEFAELPNPV
ncbi:MAG: Nif3-like dinuclear metal center hexameric protein [Gaiellaceae bacterium]